ncbi:MAG: valine--tRNA ligase, partial [Lachnospiraceae bacterium]|nr:valine--tRNA ligase [Lachnospiraceae bacterium]
NILNDDATINANGGEYEGMDRYEARKAIVEKLKELGLLVKIEDYSHNVGTHDRCKTTIEPMIKKQWFVKMDELIKPAVEAVKTGDIKLVPERMEKTYFNWTDNIRDWCISRQLWWGHRIPAYYCDECGEIVVAKEAPAKCPKCGCTHLTQDPDTLDTWFSSALWPFSTLGWPEMTEDLKYFYPTDVLVTGYDIIFFWVIRMIFSGFENMGERPFKTVLFHGLVRDSQGRKMSKSLGNGIDPLEIIDKYGADALRLTLITGNAPGNDMRFYNERVEASRNFANKIWNASRFIMMNMGDESPYKPEESALEPVDKWILSKCNTLIKDVTDNMEKYELGVAVQKVYDFIWDEFCDWYIEMVKPRLYTDTDASTKNAALWTLKHVCIESLKLLHPYMPFVTEEIFTTIQDEEESIMISKWPVFSEEFDFSEDEKAIETIKEAVRAIRNVRTGMNVAPSRKAKVFVVSKDADIRKTFEDGKLFFQSLSYASDVEIREEKGDIADDAVSVVIAGAICYLPFEDLVDIKQEIERLKKEQERLNAEISRSNGMLSNERFLSKAPEAKVREEKEKLEKYKNMLDEVTAHLEKLAK